MVFGRISLPKNPGSGHRPVHLWLLGQKVAILLHISQLPYKTKFLNSLRAEYEYFKDRLAVLSDFTRSV